MKELDLKTIVTWFGTHKKICIGIACALITVAGSSVWFLQRKPYKIIEKEKSGRIRGYFIIRAKGLCRG